MNLLRNSMIPSYDDIVPLIAKLFSRFLIGWIAYSFLEISIGLTLGVILVVLTTLTNGNLSFGFLGFFAFLNPVFGRYEFTIGMKEIMQIFFFFAFILFCIVEALKYFVK